jgi:hypothetical protein
MPELQLWYSPAALERPHLPASLEQSFDSDREGRIAATTVGALVAGGAVFVFRLLAQGQLTNDHYMHLALAQQVLLGEVPGRDFVDPGMPLMYSLSALVQYFWPGPFSEVVLTSGLVGIAAAMTYALVALMTRSWFWPVVAVFIEVALWPRLYSYPKVLVPALLLLAWWHYASKRSSQAMWAVAACTVIGILLRHDLGAFAFLAVSAAISASGNLARPRLRTWLQYVLFTALLLAPYQLFVEGFGGLAEHVREGFEFSKSDAHQLFFAWSELPGPQLFPFHRNEAAVLLYYTSWLLVLVAALHVLRRHQRENAVTTSTIVATITFLGCYIVMIMRHPIVTRVPDAAAILAVLTVYCTADTITRARSEFSSHRIRALVAAAVVALLCVGTVTSAATLGRVTERFHETRLRDGVTKVRERLSALAHVGSVWPWSWYWPNGDLPDVIRYLSACTSPDDRVLVTWAAPEYFFYAQRGFGAGHALFIPRTFESAADRQKIVERLEGERVPIALINESTRDEFARAYPELEAYLSGRYFAVGHFTTRGSSRITVAVRDGIVASGSFGDSGWPCGFESFAGVARGEPAAIQSLARVRSPRFRASRPVPGAM